MGRLRRAARAALCGVLMLAASAGAAQDRSGFDTGGMDRNVRPGDDFFAYANGEWARRTPIPADRSTVGTIGALDDRSREQVRAILDEAARDAGSRMGTAYRAFLDTAAIERLGMAPVAAMLARLNAVGTRDAYVAAAADAGRRGVALPLDFKVEPDDGDPDRYALIVSQAGLGMPDRDYYLSGTAAMRDARAAYRRYLAATLALGGVTDAGAADRLLAFETRIARASWTSAASRDAQRTYNPLPLGRAGPRLAALAHALGYRTARAIVRQPDAVAAILGLVDTAPVATLRDMLIVRTLHRYAAVLPAAVHDADFAFYGRAIDGVDTPEPRWRQAVAFVLDAVPDDVSRVYVARHFSPATRAAAQRMVDNLVAAFGRRIDALDWMTPATKARARRKLASFRAQVGYPDRWHDYGLLAMRDGDAFGNAQRAAAFHHDWDAAKVGRPVYRWEWSATPMTVDAFANYPKVAIVFPAAILQPPFFDAGVDPAVNYGGIGASIAHEMTHHFDDQGARYDERGRLAAWWSARDRAAFEARTGKLAAQFDQYAPLPGTHVDGTLTLGENIADLGGLAIAYDAWHAALDGKPAPVIDGLTGEARFFLGWAQIWRLRYRDADLRRRLLTNPHAPAPQRVWTVRNLDAFYPAFGVEPADRLYLKPADRVRIW
ncbi:M13 family metallopeptidase [Massilia sp. Root335]|uniref:M13 family metallopeptidase n=2 Tax=Massilia TaxID=149698 RepID=UPI0009EC02F2|nr:M13 family metallopeptidase [Massilia sp. Root335]